MTKAETKAYLAIPDETPGLGYTITHKREREAYVKGYHQAIEDACERLKKITRIVKGKELLIDDFKSYMEE